MAGRFEFDPDKMFGTKAIRDLERMNVGLLGHSKLVDSLIGKNSIAAAMTESGKLAERFRPFPELAFLGHAETLGVSQAHELFGAKHRSLFEALRVTQMHEALGMQPFRGLGLESAFELAFPEALRSIGLSNMDSLIGSTALLGHSWTKPSAILAAFAEPDLGGVLTWLEADEPEVARLRCYPSTTTCRVKPREYTLNLM
jgi:hypothetical protein